MTAVDLRHMAQDVVDGKPYDRRRLIHVTGSALVDHTSRMLHYAKTRQPRDLMPAEMTGSLNWTANRTGVHFYTWSWEPALTGKQVSLHNANGCDHCRGDFDKPEDRRAAIATCSAPLFYTSTESEKVTWTEIARMLDPALTDERCERMAELNVMRNAHEEERVEWRRTYVRPGIGTDEQLDAQQEKIDAWTKRSWEIDAACREHAARTWELAWGEEMLRNLKDLMAS